MPRPAAVASAPTPERIDALLEKAEAALTILSQAVSSGEYQQEDRDPSIAAAEGDLKRLLATLRDTMGALSKEHEAGRPGLLTIFGRDAATGERLERVRAVLDAASYTVGAQDGPLASCLEHLQKLEQAMEAALEESQAPQQEVRPAQEEQRVVESNAYELPPAPEEEDSHHHVVQKKDYAPENIPTMAPITDPQKAQKESRAQKVDTKSEEKSGMTEDEQINAYRQEKLAAGFPTSEQYEAANATGAQREMRPETVLENGVKYTGEWIGSLRDGEGVEIRPDGSSYMGQFVLGQAHGKGVYSQKDGLTIAGKWYGGKLNGSGIESHPDGTTYEGQYKEGVKSGFGTYTYEEGSVYEGEFEQDGMHGSGVYVSANGYHGGRYQGEWNSNRMHGSGLFKVPDGRMYDGQYLNDRRNGSGTFSWPDGRVHEGQWKLGKMHGAGRAVFPDGAEKKGVWEDGKLIRWKPDEDGKVAEAAPAPVAPVGGQMRDARTGDYDAAQAQPDAKGHAGRV